MRGGERDEDEDKDEDEEGCAYAHWPRGLRLRALFVGKCVWGVRLGMGINGHGVALEIGFWCGI